jgi:hypothetical protein
VIRIGDRAYRDFFDYAKEQFESQPDAESSEAKQKPESEDRRAMLEAIEAHKHAHEPTEQQARESLEQLVGAKTAKDWERWHDQ